MYEYDVIANPKRKTKTKFCEVFCFFVTLLDTSLARERESLSGYSYSSTSKMEMENECEYHIIVYFC